MAAAINVGGADFARSLAVLRPMAGRAAQTAAEGDDRRFFIFFIMLFGTAALLTLMAWYLPTTQYGLSFADRAGPRMFACDSAVIATGTGPGGFISVPKYSYVYADKLKRLLDSSGNLKGGTIKSLLSYLRSANEKSTFAGHTMPRVRPALGSTSTVSNVPSMFSPLDGRKSQGFADVERPPATGNILFGSGNPVSRASEPSSPLTGGHGHLSATGRSFVPGSSDEAGETSPSPNSGAPLSNIPPSCNEVNLPQGAISLRTPAEAVAFDIHDGRPVHGVRVIVYDVAGIKYLLLMDDALLRFWLSVV